MVGSGPNGADGEEGKGEGWQGPNSQSVATPLYDLPEEVSTRDKLKHPAMWDPVDVLPRLPQVTQNVVTVDVDCQTDGEQQNSCREASVCQPGVLEVVTVQQVVSLQEAVQRAEDDGGEDDLQRNRPSSGQQGVDTAPVEVVQHEGPEQQRPAGAAVRFFGTQQEQQRYQQGRNLLEEPGQRTGPAAAVRLRKAAVASAVAGLPQQEGGPAEHHGPAERGHGGLSALHQPGERRPGPGNNQSASGFGQKNKTGFRVSSSTD